MHVFFNYMCATTRKVAAKKPSTAIIGLVTCREIGRQLALVWGVNVIIGTKTDGADELVEAAITRTRPLFSQQLNRHIVITAGIQSCTPRGTNMIRLAEMGKQQEAQNTA